MQIPILVEPIEGGRFRARTGAPFDIEVEAKTRLDAIRGVEDAIGKRKQNGAEIFLSEISETPSVGKYAGMWDPNDPFIQEWKEAIEEYRRKVDEGPDYPWLEQPETKAS